MAVVLVRRKGKSVTLRSSAPGQPVPEVSGFLRVKYKRRLGVESIVLMFALRERERKC